MLRICYQYIERRKYIVKVFQGRGDLPEEPWNVSRLSLDFTQLALYDLMHDAKPPDAPEDAFAWTIPLQEHEMLCLQHVYADNIRIGIILRARAGSLENIKSLGHYFSGEQREELANVRAERISRARIVSPVLRR